MAMKHHGFQDVRYENVRMLIGDPNRDLRVSLNSQLNQAGFPAVPHTDSTKGLRERAAEDGVDVLVCDVDLPGDDFLDTVRQIRHSEVGENPFPIVIALIADPDHEKVHRAINSGVDEILSKPVSVGAIMERIQKLTSARKPFVVANDYVGPNRREEGRTDVQTPIFIEAPNPLKILAGGGTLEDYRRAVERAVKELKQQALTCRARQIAFLTARMKGGRITCQPSDAPGVGTCLDRIVHIADDMDRRVAGSPHAHVGDLCRSMRELAVRMRASPGTQPRQKELALMEKLSEATIIAFKGGADNAAIAQDISASIPCA